MKKLFEHCVYTIALPGKLMDASRNGAPLPEAKRWVSAQRMLKQAGGAACELPILFADSRDCSKLIGWSVLKGVRVTDTGTRYRIGRLWALNGKTPQDLRLLSSGDKIAPDYIRPYALCHTPAFLQRQAASPQTFQLSADTESIAPVRREQSKKSVNRRAALIDPEVALRRAWPAIVTECRKVLGSEQHYQAVVYYCLRTTGSVPVKQLGMNVKMGLYSPKTAYWRGRANARNEAYRGHCEPIPDVVIFDPDIAGDWRRRRYEETLKHIVGAVEIKASERDASRLRPKEIIEDIRKLANHRREKIKQHSRGFFTAVIVIDTAPDQDERMTSHALDQVRRAAGEAKVECYYLPAVGPPIPAIG